MQNATPQKTNPLPDGPQTGGVSSALDRIGLTRAHKIILAVVLAGGFFDVFEQNGAAVTGPALQEAWGIQATQVSLMASITFGAMVVGGILTGILADRAGRRTLFAFNLLIYSAGGLLCAFSPNFEVLLVGRVIVGLALGGELTIALPFLSELMPTKFRGTAVSLFNLGAGGLGNPMAFLFGTLILGVLGPTLNEFGGAWRWYFGLLALPALLVLYVRRNLPETPRFLLSKGHVHEANKALTKLASGRLHRREFEVTEYVTEADAGVRISDSGQSFKQNVGLLFKGRYLRNTLTVGISSFMSFGGQLAVLTLIPLILVSRGFSITSSLGFTAAMQGGALLGTIVAAFVNRKFPRRMVMVVSGIGAGIFGLLFALLGTTVPTIIFYGFVFNFFVLLANTTIWAWAPELFPTVVRATGTGLIVNSGMLGQAVMPLVAGAIFAQFGLVVMFTVVAAMYGTVVVLSLLAPETQGKSLDEMHGEE